MLKVKLLGQYECYTWKNFLNILIGTLRVFFLHFQDSAAEKCVEVQDKTFTSIPIGYGKFILREIFV